MVEIIVVTLLQTVNQEAYKGGKTHFYQDMKNVVRRAFIQGTDNEFIGTKTNNLPEPQDFVLHRTSKSVKNPSFILSISHLV